MVYTADSIQKFDSKSNRTADSIRDSIRTQKNDLQGPSLPNLHLADGRLHQLHEGWSLCKKDQRQIETFKMCCFRRLLRVSRTRHKTNEWVLLELNEERTNTKHKETKGRLLWTYEQRQFSGEVYYMSRKIGWRTKVDWRYRAMYWLG